MCVCACVCQSAPEWDSIYLNFVEGASCIRATDTTRRVNVPAAAAVAPVTTLTRIRRSLYAARFHIPAGFVSRLLRISSRIWVSGHHSGNSLFWLDVTTQVSLGYFKLFVIFHYCWWPPWGCTMAQVLRNTTMVTTMRHSSGTVHAVVPIVLTLRWSDNHNKIIAITNVRVTVSDILSYGETYVVLSYGGRSCTNDPYQYSCNVVSIKRDFMS